MKIFPKVASLCILMSFNSACDKVDPNIGSNIDDNSSTSISSNTTTDVSSITNSLPQLISFPEVQLKLAQPKGFSKSTNFLGFEQKESGSSIVITKIEQSYVDNADQFTEENLKSKGMRLISKDSVKISNLQGILLNISQSVNSQEFEKWNLIFGDTNTTYIINANFLNTHSSVMSELIKDSLLKTSLDPAQ